MKDNAQLTDKITKLLADFLGVETGDFTPEDSLTENLHMTASDLTDFVEILNLAGVDTSELNLEEVETVEDLYEKLI